MGVWGQHGEVSLRDVATVEVGGRWGNAHAPVAAGTVPSHWSRWRWRRWWRRRTPSTGTPNAPAGAHSLGLYRGEVGSHFGVGRVPDGGGESLSDEFTVDEGVADDDVTQQTIELVAIGHVVDQPNRLAGYELSQKRSRFRCEARSHFGCINSDQTHRLGSTVDYRPEGVTVGDDWTM